LKSANKYKRTSKLNRLNLVKDRDITRIKSMIKTKRLAQRAVNS